MPNPCRPLFRGVTLLVLLFVFSQSFSQVRLLYPGQGNVVIAAPVVSFYNESSGFAAFHEGIAFTSDTGRTWVNRPVTYSNLEWQQFPSISWFFSPNGVKAFDANNLIAWGDFGFVPAIITSNDGGQTWKIVYASHLFTDYLLRGSTDLVFPSGNNIAFAFDDHRIVKSTNRGATWNVVYQNMNRLFNKFCAVNDNIVFAAELNQNTQSIFRTTDAGLNWTQIPLPQAGSSGALSGFFFSDANNGWISLNDITYTTGNAGASWTAITDPNYKIQLHEIRFFSSTTGYGSQREQELVKTIDGGRTWEPFVRDSRIPASRIHYYSQDRFWVSGRLNQEIGIISNVNTARVLPKAFFSIDTSNLRPSYQVRLNSFSNPLYSSYWIVNGRQIGTSQDITYSHNPAVLRDTITLMVSYNGRSDTSTIYQNFHNTIAATDASPMYGKENDVITIRGRGLLSVTSVSFGGVSAGFIKMNDSTIRAVLAKGASGTNFCSRGHDHGQHRYR